MSSTATSPTHATTHRRKQSKSANKGQFTSKTRRQPIYRFEIFLTGLARHEKDPGFPVRFFTSTKFAATVGKYVDDVNNLAGLTFREKDAAGRERGTRTRMKTLADKCVSALVAYYGPASLTLADFGIEPKRSRRRRKKAGPAAAAGAGSGTGGGSSPPAAPVGPTLVPSPSPSSSPPLAAAPPASPSPSSMRLRN